MGNGEGTPCARHVTVHKCCEPHEPIACSMPATVYATVGFILCVQECEVHQCALKHHAACCLAALKSSTACAVCQHNQTLTKKKSQSSKTITGALALSQTDRNWDPCVDIDCRHGMQPRCIFIRLLDPTVCLASTDS